MRFTEEKREETECKKTAVTSEYMFKAGRKKKRLVSDGGNKITNCRREISAR